MGRLKPTPPVRVLVALLAFAALSAAGGPAGTPALDLAHSPWPSKWIACPGADPRSPAVYHFRKRVALPEAPRIYIVHVSADNRFVLFVNGVRVGEGPAQGDLDHWRYETFDIAPLLRAGENLVAATVWNYGALAPMAQMSDQSGFLVQGHSDGRGGRRTPTAPGRSSGSRARASSPISPSDVPNYYAAPPGRGPGRHALRLGLAGDRRRVRRLETGRHGRPGGARPVPQRLPRRHGLGPQPVASRSRRAAPDGAFRDRGGADRPRRGREARSPAFPPRSPPTPRPAS